jgi:pimeloyl-ACP methyl ester carboxylesterase
VRARYPDSDGFVERDGVRIAYELYEGAAPTVLFVPQPAFGHARGLKSHIPYLGRHFRLLVVEGRGNGRSDRPRDPAAYSSAELAADCIEVMDATDTASAVPISWSPRGLVTLRLATESPERVEAAIFVTPHLWPNDWWSKPYVGGPKEAYADDEVFNPHYMLSDWPRFLERWGAKIFRNPHSSKQREDFVEYGLATDGETFVASLRGTDLMTRDEALAKARTVRCPTLVLRNGGGSMGPKDCSEPLAEAMGGRLHTFEGLGPAVAGRWPVIFNITVRDFLESVRSGRASGRLATSGRER